MEITFRDIMLKEKETFRQLLESYWREIDPEFNQSKIFIDKYVDYIFNNKNRKIKWIIQKQKAVGFLIYYEYDRNEEQKALHVAEFYIKSSCRRQGIGSQALKLLLTNYPEHQEIRLEALKENKTALEFWKKNEFSEWKYILKRRTKGE